MNILFWIDRDRVFSFEKCNNDTKNVFIPCSHPKTVSSLSKARSQIPPPAPLHAVDELVWMVSLPSVHEGVSMDHCHVMPNRYEED